MAIKKYGNLKVDKTKPLNSDKAEDAQQQTEHQLYLPHYRPHLCPCAPSCSYPKCLGMLYKQVRHFESVPVGTKFIIKSLGTNISSWNSTEKQHLFPPLSCSQS
jgi:hypothetical protein